jgi:hypothetical protein
MATNYFIIQAILYVFMLSFIHSMATKNLLYKSIKLKLV